MDIIDEASEREEELRQRALGKRKPNGPTPTGFCLNVECREPLPPEHRWCGPECRTRYERQIQVQIDKLGKYYDDEVSGD